MTRYSNSPPTPLAPPPRRRNGRLRRWNILPRPRWRFLRRRMPFRAVVHGFYAVGTYFAVLVGGFYAVESPSESSSAPPTPLRPAPETPAPLSTPLALTPETPAAEKFYGLQGLKGQKPLPIVQIVRKVRRQIISTPLALTPETPAALTTI